MFANAKARLRFWREWLRWFWQSPSRVDYQDQDSWQIAMDRWFAREPKQPMKGTNNGGFNR